MSYIPAINGIVNTSNSTSTPLTAGSTFTGTSADVLLYATVAVSAFSDVNSSASGFTVQFSANGTNWDFIKSFTLSGNDIQNHILPVSARYFRVVFTNGGSNQTSFRLQTILHPEKNKDITRTVSDGINYLTTDCTVTNSVVNGVYQSNNSIRPLSLDNENNLLVSLAEPSSAFGDIRVESPTPTCQVDFVYGINANRLTTTLVASGGATTVNGMASLTSGAATNSSSTLISKDYLKYRDGQGGLARFTALYTTGVANNTQIAGVGTASDGYFFGYNGTSFGILHRSSSSGSLVNTWIQQGNWNVDTLNGSSGNPSNMTLVQTNGNIYQIAYTFLGFGNVYFYVTNPASGKFLLVHIIKYANGNTNLLVRNPTFPLFWQTANTTNASNITLRAGSGAQFNEGIVKYLGPRYSKANNKNTTATNVNMVTIRNNTTFNGITNQSNIVLRSASAGAISTAAAVSIYSLVLNATLGGTPSYTNIDATNSITAYDTAGTTVTGGTTVFIFCIGTASANFIDLTEANIVLNPGDILTVACRSLANTTSAVSLNWSEDI